MAESNRTEPATPKKRREARDRGEVARSMEISAAINMLVGLTAFCGFSGYFFKHLREVITVTYTNFLSVPLSALNLVDVMRFIIIKLFIMMIPVLFIIIVSTMATNYLQTGFHITPKAIEPKLSKLNPINGAKRLFSMRAWIELAKSCIKLIFVIWIGWSVIKGNLDHIIMMVNATFYAALIAVGAVIWEVIWKLGLFFLIVGILDYFWQRYEFEKKQRMTKQEVRDEYRQQEGDVQIKSKRRAKHRKLTMTRIAAEVAKADVVTTNPTHYAVALRYDQNSMRAPKVVAKGENNWAKIIRRIALKHQVPVIENKPVTRAIYKNVEVGQEIPPMLYKAVAEILAALFKIRARKGYRA